MQENNELICKFCNKQFKREINYIKHHCEKMKRYDLFKTSIGLVAYIAFNQWRKIQKYPSVNVDVFTNSRYFNAFIKFAKFSRIQQIPDIVGYISLMVDKQLLPFYWSDFDVYDCYIQNFDNEYSVDSKIDISIETLHELSKQLNCQLSDVFNHVTPIQILRGITSRKISPWLLLPSKKFMNFIMYRSNKEERLLFNSFVDVAIWKQHFLENPKKLLEIKNINLQLGI